VKAVIAALRKHPYLNASMDDEHEEIILKKYYNIGIAVDVGDGLLVPVIKGADSKSIPQLAKEISELAERAKSRKLDIMDMQGGTFTVTNIGGIGGLFATPIINYPEVAILAVGKIHEKPSIHKGKIAARKFMPLSLAFDHRVLDGAEAARFMNDLIEHLEDPHLFLVEK
jgi:pyruvate dehydrogenase E2 component (dihydrolipoamide acetyltransferase)